MFPQFISYLLIPLLVLLTFPIISFLYLTFIPPLLVILVFLLISYAIFYPVYDLYKHPRLIPDWLFNIKRYILNRPRLILFRIEFSLHLRTRDVYPGMYDPGPPFPSLWPEEDTDRYGRLKRIVRLVGVAIKQWIYDRLDIPYGYCKEEIIERRKKEKAERGSRGWFSWKKDERGSIDWNNKGLYGYGHIYEMNGPQANYGYPPMSTSPPPPPYTLQLRCTCSTTCELHPVRYILEQESILPKGTIVIPSLMVQSYNGWNQDKQSRSIYWNGGYERF
ncbi:hypothetical protein I203_107771 [Kwoniella mangroviensis CBS 8507]|uniref:hypothetical protein n=1 Tax=Kwoniella mangroviensis CBS 8507 TaxID=1296122 RepID=UPI00080CE059|nr:uncharacterized protein I203_08340 [Kwoniella mangroviensis CBS 8507]OCF62600.1 hypothetical protein I203_08340 [Kwoniella mangroviensis CBS 8507]